MENIERAFELAKIHNLAASYDPDDNDLGSSLASPVAPYAEGMHEYSQPGEQRQHHLRTTLRKPEGDNDSLKSRKHRFSKRHSKSGLAAVF